MQSSENQATTKSSLEQFIEEKGELGSSHIEPKGSFYDSYKSWVEAKGDFPVIANAIGRQMTALGFGEYRNKSVRCWRGIRLIVSPEAQEAPNKAESSNAPVPAPSIPAATKVRLEEPNTPAHKAEVETPIFSFPKEEPCYSLLRRNMGV